MDEIIWPAKKYHYAQDKAGQRECDEWNACLDACKSAYEKHKPGKGLEPLDEEKLDEFLKGFHVVINDTHRTLPREIAKAICAKFAAPSLPTVEEIEDIIRANGEYRERFAVGLMDMVDVHVKPLAKTLHALLTNPAIKEK